MPDFAPPPGPSGALPTPLTVVGIGASAGGLEACTALVRGLPDGNGMAFILVQHLDPTHDNLLVPLLAAHTAMPVLEAADGMPIERDHLYIIPPGALLSVGSGLLRVSRPQEPRGRRLPFDGLLASMAQECRERAVCIVLSGTGSDGTLGLAAIKHRGGLVIVQDPEDARYDGMPRSAIATGIADLVLPAADIAHALDTHHHPAAAAPPGENGEDGEDERLFREIIGTLRTSTRHDFTAYKPGTLQRRIERRMQMAGAPGLARYLDQLRRDPAETGRLASDLLINVTSFFRDPAVFRRLETEVIPALIRAHDPAQPLRLWTVGCSTGEETWSLAMLFHEQLARTSPAIRLQVFASDVDADAVADARAGRYPPSIAAEVSASRLDRFFTRDEQGFRVTPELRSLVVFSVQDVLADPPFSRMDFISCRNLLIYLQRPAQDRVLSLFDFALNQGGVLLLGAAETIGRSEGRFEPIGKPERIYRRIGRGRPPGVQFPMALAGRAPRAEAPVPAPPAVPALARLGQRLLLEAFAPAAVLVNDRDECLYALGPVDRYLQVPTGGATQNVLTLAREGVRPKLRAALRRAPPGPAAPPHGPPRFDIEVRPVEGPGDATRMVCFVEHRAAHPQPDPARPGADPRAAELEHELAALRIELAEALRGSELWREEQKALSEEALSVSEEHQSANEELLTSKEELQSLNEELTALNSQLQETLERQRTTANDMQNVLYSTDVATLFLDRDLNIRFFTPATRSLFNVIPGDVGRPLTDLVSLAADAALPADAAAVLHDLVPRDCEIEAGDTWFVRRVLPYRTEDGGVAGVVITFTDVTERRHAARALEAAKHEAERANAAKSRFLAAASHDLRQPLQTLSLLRTLLAKAVTGEAAERLVVRLGDTLGAMTGMLDTLLDIDQIEAGMVRAAVVTVPVAGLLTRLRDEYGYQAQAQGLAWRVVPCSLSVRSDPALLEQMLRNLVSNALKYTARGTVLLGCRRHGATLRIEVRDTGIGIPADKLDTIFEEYSQLGNAARDRGKGLGLGLSIVRRLAELMGHAVHVRSRPGAGSVFSIEVPLDMPKAAAPVRPGAPVIFVVDDDAALRGALRELLEAEGRAVEDHASAEAFLHAYRPGRGACVLVDANLPGLGGLDLLRRLRGTGDRIPAIVITGHGDVAMAVGAMRAGASDFIEKPVGAADLLASLDRALEQSSESGRLSSWRAGAARAVSGLTGRQREVMALVIAGHPSKNIAADLGISQRTVENHRAAIMERTGSKSLPALARLALAAAWTGSDQSLIAAGSGKT